MTKASRETRKLLRLHAQDACTPKQERKLLHKADTSSSVRQELMPPPQIVNRFLKAAESGDDKIVLPIVAVYPHLANLEHGPSDSRSSALLVAVANGSERVVEILLQAGAETEFRGTGWGNRTPLHRAAELNYDVAAGLDPERKKRKTPKNMVTMLLDHGAEAEAKGSSFLQIRDSISPLAAACGNDNLETAIVLIEKGKADVNAQGSQGVNPLIACTANALGGSRRAETIKLLLDHGANPNVRVTQGDTTSLRSGDTPLLLISGNRNFYVDDTESFKLLLNAGANVKACNVYGTTPLMAAATSHQSLEIINLLLEKGANPDALDEQGQTALGRAQAFAEYASGKKGFNKWVINANQAIIERLALVTTVASRALPKQTVSAALQLRVD